MNARTKFRQMMSATGYVVAPGAYDTLTARMVQLAGFKAVYLTGGGYSRANGYPDIGLLTMTEVVQWISRTGGRRGHSCNCGYGCGLRECDECRAKRAGV